MTSTYDDKDEDPESALNDNERYKVVWQVLRALRSHDERLEAEINTFNYSSDHKSKHIIIGGIDNGESNPEPPLIGGSYILDDFGNAFLARLVLKVGNREYIENWAKSVADIMPDLIGRLTKICQAEEYGTRQFKPAFKRYVKGLRECVNDNVPDSQAIDMLAQQIITKPIFEKLFTHDGGFALKNSVSTYIDKMLEEIDAKNGLKDIQNKLDRFYETVEITLNGIDCAKLASV